ncbi:MAG: Yip1 family protein [Archaeoglobaceae archaeon]
MADLLEDIYGTLFSPVSTFKRMIDERTSIVFAVIVVLVASMCSGAGSALTQSALSSSFGAYPGLETYELQSMVSPTASLFMGVVGGILGWVIITGVLHLVAKALGGKGTFGGMLVLMGFATLPNIFQAPVGLIAYFSGGLSGLTVALGLGALLGLWILALDVIAIREAHGFSTGKAIVTLILPVVLLVVLALVLVAIFLVAVM